jgi:hypothetical protein
MAHGLQQGCQSKLMHTTSGSEITFELISSLHCTSNYNTRVST